MELVSNMLDCPADNPIMTRARSDTKRVYAALLRIYYYKWNTFSSCYFEKNLLRLYFLYTHRKYNF